MEKKRLSKFEKEIDNAIFGAKILRNQLEIEILGPQNWKQGYNVLYKNVSEYPLHYAHLSPRVKEVQRNLSVYNNKGNRLSIVPSYVVEKTLCEICEYYTSKANEIVDEEENRIINELIDDPIDFSTVFCYDNGESQAQIQSIHQRMSRIALNLETAGKENRTSYFYIDRILILVHTYKNFFIPLVELDTPAGQGECFSLDYSVENLREKSMIHRLFLLFGFQSLYFPLEVEESASNHIMILSPEGTLFQHAGVSGIEETEIKEKYRDLRKSLDDDLIYFRIPPEDADIIYECWRLSTSEESVESPQAHNPTSSTENNTDREKGGPTIEVKIGISRDFPWRLSLIRILTLLMYLSIFIPAVTLLIFKSCTDFSVLMGTMILVVTILISLGIYAMDKTFLHEYIAAQVIILLFLFIVEVACLHHFS